MIDLRALDDEFRVVGETRCADTETAEEIARVTLREGEGVIAHVEWWAWDMPGQVLWHRLVTRGEEVER